MASLQHDPDWTFLSNHSHVLYCISFFPEVRIRDIAEMVNITERAVQRIVVDLERGGYITRKRVGRQNRYRLKRGLHLRHPLERHVEVGRLLTILQPGKRAPDRKTSAAATRRRRNHSATRSALKPVALLKRGRKKAAGATRSRVGTTS